MTDIIDRVARAIFTVQTSNTSDEIWAQINPEYPHEIARAAIAAMREPTEKMMIEGGGVVPADEAEYRPDRAEQTAHDVWQAMIDAALKEKK